MHFGGTVPIWINPQLVDWLWLTREAKKRALCIASDEGALFQGKEDTSNAAPFPSILSSLFF